MADPVITENPEARRYEIRDGERGVLGHLEYVPGRDAVVLPHTEVDPSLQGLGWGGRLVRFALDDLRAKGARVVPTCSFVVRWMELHPEYEDLRHRP
ncbi:MAG TPA: GNAT family N-acetyltransferase [Glycomyces sp.]|nr:GNAT family N-acetyltransferase [Glycomyces sp.]